MDRLKGQLVTTMIDEDFFKDIKLKGQIVDTGSKDFKLRIIKNEMQNLGYEISCERLQLKLLKNIANILLGKGEVRFKEVIHAKLLRDDITDDDNDRYRNAEVTLSFKLQRIVPPSPELTVRYSGSLVSKHIDKNTLFSQIRNLKNHIRSLDRRYGDLSKRYNGIKNDVNLEKRDLVEERARLQEELRIIEEKLNTL